MRVNKTVIILLGLISIFVSFQLFTFFGLNHRLLSVAAKTKWQSTEEKEDKITVIVDSAIKEVEADKKVMEPESVPEEPKKEIVNISKIEEKTEVAKATSLHYPGNKKTALVIVAYNRPQYLQRTFNSLITTLSSPLNHVLVDIVLSQDGYLTVLDDVVAQAKSDIKKKLPDFSFNHIHHSQTTLPGDSGYHKLARHFGWFLNELFNNYHYEQVIILEDDLDIAPDFFEFFDATSPLLWKDPTIFCISAWNDNGQSGHVADPERLYRSDFFPGLGWMLTKDLWEELGSSWPGAYWDDWLRHPDRRHERVCIRPEISRSYTFGVKGTSNSQFYSQFLEGIQKNEQFVRFSEKNMDFLIKANYDAYWKDTIEKATVITDLRELPENSSGSFKIFYDNKRGRVSFVRLAMQLHIMHDEKAGVYRTAYMGVVAVRHLGTQLYIVPRNGPSFDYNSFY